MPPRAPARRTRRPARAAGRGTRPCGSPARAGGTSDCTPDVEQLQLPAQGARQDQRLARHVQPAQVDAGVRLGVAAVHRLAHQAREGLAGLQARCRGSPACRSARRAPMRSRRRRRISPSVASITGHRRADRGLVAEAAAARVSESNTACGPVSGILLAVDHAVAAPERQLQRGHRRVAGGHVDHDARRPARRHPRWRRGPAGASRTRCWRTRRPHALAADTRCAAPRATGPFRRRPRRRGRTRRRCEARAPSRSACSPADSSNWRTSARPTLPAPKMISGTRFMSSFDASSDWTTDR